MNKDQILAQIRDMIGAQNAQESQLTLNIYFVESMIVGPGDFRHVVTQTTTVGTRNPAANVSQSVASDLYRDHANIQGKSEMNIMGIGELAAAAGGYLVAKASGKLAENVGGEVGSRIVELWDKVTGKLTGKEALADFEQHPEDADTQAALRLQLKKALEADPAFREEVASLVGELDQKGGRDAISQVANVTGDQNKVAQTAGNQNKITM